MSFVGTFGTFTTAQLAIYAAQKGLSVTGNNIANINTTGYTRQRLDQISFKTGGADRYHSQYDARVGNGVLCTGVSQIRDPYLDIRYRTENATVGALNKTLSGLDSLAAIIDEVAKGEDEHGLIDAQLSDFLKTLQNLSVFTGQEEYDTQVRSSATTLAKLFNKAAASLEQVRQNTEKSLKQDLATVNELLVNIRHLNTEIRKSDIHGDGALEMRDERNRLIDELSSYIKIDVTYSMEDLGAGQQVEKLTIKMADANPDGSVRSDSSTLVDGIFCAQVCAPKANNPVTADGKYLTPTGQPTNDAAKADLEFDENYNMMVSKLVDQNGFRWKEFVRSTATEITGPQCAEGIANAKDLADKAAAATPPNPDIKFDPDSNTLTEITREGNVITTTTTTYLATDDPDVYQKVVNVNRYSEETALDDNDLYGALQSTRELLTENGEFIDRDVVLGEEIGCDENAAVKRGIPYYQKSLDLLARQFAEVYNKANQGYMVDETGAYVNEDGERLTWGDGTPGTTIDANVWAEDFKDDFKLELDKFRDPDAPDLATGYRDALPKYLDAKGAQKNADGTYKTAVTNGTTHYVDADGNAITWNDGTPGTPIVQGQDLTDDQKTKVVDELGPKLDPTKEEDKALLAIIARINTPDPNNPVTDEEYQALFERYITNNGAYEAPNSGVLFSNHGSGNDPTNITAANISVSKAWASNEVHVVASFVRPANLETGTTDNSNIIHMRALMETKMDYLPGAINENAVTGDVSMFHGTFQEMLANIEGVLGNDIRSTTIMLNDHYEAAVELDSSRMNVSGVDLNDEATNLMQYQKSYSAACRLMTVLDEVLDRLINNTGIAGR